MTNHVSDSASIRQLRYLGVCGAFGAFVLLISDWVMLGAPTSGQEISVKWLDVLAAMPKWRLTCGGLGGPIGACLYPFGFGQLYLGLRPGGRPLAFLCFLCFTFSFVCLGAFHAAFPFAGYLHSIYETLNANPAVEHAYANAMAYLGTMYYVGLAPAVIPILLMPWLVLSGHTKYPKWFVLANPAIFWIGSLAFRYIPAPLGGPLVMGSGNIAFFLFFCFSTVALWHGGKNGRQQTPE